MGLLAPLALGFLPLLALITLLYLLRLRRPETAVSSLQLWQALLTDREANAPWQRLSASFLLLLQLLIAAALILALARPWATAAEAGGRNLVVIVDTSASMGATDGPGGHTRLSEAVSRAWTRIVALPSNGTATVIAAADHARVVAPAGASLDEIRRALDGLQPQPANTDLSEALALAAGLSAAAPDPEVLVYSDGRFPDPRPAVATLPAPIHFVPLGTHGDNQAVVGLSLRRKGASLSLFALVLNAAPAQVTRRLDIDLDGVPWAGRPLTLPPGTTTSLQVDEVPLTTQVAHVHLAGRDDLAVDDEGWTLNRQTEPASVLLVSDDNRFLENALVLLPDVALSRTTPAAYTPQLTATLTVFDRAVPTGTLPAGNLLFIAPPASTPLFQVSGVLTDPVPLLGGAAAGADGAAAAPGGDPLLRYTDLSDLHIAAATRLERPDWARVVLDSDGGPLILAGDVDGHHVAVIAFDLHNSDLPLQTAFPLLMRNLMGDLLPPAPAGTADYTHPGDPIPVTADVQDGVDRVTVTGPAGDQIAAYTVSARSPRVEIDQTRDLGLYVVHQWAGRQEIRRDGFVVDLFSEDESRTAPRTAPLLPATHPAASTPGNGGEGARAEWWQIAAALALFALVGEWLATHRLGLRQLGGRLAAWRRRETFGNP